VFCSVWEHHCTHADLTHVVLLSKLFPKFFPLLFLPYDFYPNGSSVIICYKILFASQHLRLNYVLPLRINFGSAICLSHSTIVICRPDGGVDDTRTADRNSSAGHFAS
jgi:hypothetical protein